MIPSWTEIILLLVIALCIFGLGRLGDISEAIGQLRARLQRGLPEDDAIDITPESDRDGGGQIDGSTGGESTGGDPPANQA